MVGGAVPRLTLTTTGSGSGVLVGAAVGGGSAGASTPAVVFTATVGAAGCCWQALSASPASSRSRARCLTSPPARAARGLAPSPCHGEGGMGRDVYVFLTMFGRRAGNLIIPRLPLR